MARLDFVELDERRMELDAAVRGAPIPDRFCTTSAWLIPARTAFLPESHPWIHRYDEGFVPLHRVETALGPTLMPLEASWGLAAPFIGPDLRALARRFAEDAAQSHGEWKALFLSGLVRGGADFTALLHALGRRFRLGIGQPTVRCVASLQGGLDGFLARRSAHFRKNLRRAQRGASQVTFERLMPTDPDVALALYERVLAIEARSWKGMEGHGIQQGAMRVFYAHMLPRLATVGGLRLTFAAVGGEPVGYVLGGVQGDTYRGLQISYDARFEALSLGNLLQANTIEGLCAEGVQRYDLGTDMAYKRAWAEVQVETVPLVVR